MYLKTDALAEEAVQEIFTKVWTGRTKLKEINNLESWLFIISKNYLLNAINKWAHNKAVEKSWGIDHLNETEEQHDQEHYYEILEKATAGLSPQQREVFKLAKEQGFTYKEIAEQLNLSPLTVKTHLQRAMQHIKEYLAAHNEIVMLLMLAHFN